MGRVEGKVALVTGAASGSGRATAQMLVAEGARVMLTDVQDDLGAQVAARKSLLDVPFEDGVKHLVGRQAVLVGLARPQLRARRLVDRRLGDRRRPAGAPGRGRAQSFSRMR